MARNIATLLLLFAYGSCMEMRETVERMVMVRTTGSDLQPAATGYIYKKESDGPASVTKMGPSEVIEHFSKMYKPEPYKEPTAAAENEDGDKAASYKNQELVKPVEEVADNLEHIDGLANEDYDRMFEDYAKRFGNYRSDFTDYVHGVGSDSHRPYHLFGDEDFATKPYGRYADNGHLGFGDHNGQGKSGHYDTEKITGFSVSKSSQYKNGVDGNGRHYNHEEYKDDKGHNIHHDQGEAIDRFQRDFDKDEIKKDHDFNDQTSHKNGLYTHAIRHGDYGPSTRGQQDEARDSYDADSSEESGKSGQDLYGGFGIRDEPRTSKSYRYEIKH